jgi:hypothetical protein
VAGFTSRDDIISELTTNGKKDEYNFYKVSSAPEAAGVWHSLWTGTGSPGAGANPATTPGTVMESDSTTPKSGSMYFPDRSTDLRFLLSFGACATQNCTLMLYDYLAGVSGISLASTGSKTVNSGALTRYSGTAATLNEVWLETTTAGTTTAPVVNLNSYTSSDGSTGLAGPNLTLPSTTMNVQSMVQLPMNAAEQGVRSVEAGLNVGTAGTAIVVNVMIIRPLARIGLIANIWNEVSFLDDTMGLPQIYDNACLGLAFLASGTTATTFWGNITCAYG